MAPLHGPEDVFDEDQFKRSGAIDRDRNILFPVIFSGFGRRPAGKIPELGEHTREILQGVGYSKDDIKKFEEMKVI